MLKGQNSALEIRSLRTQRGSGCNTIIKTNPVKDDGLVREGLLEGTMTLEPPRSQQEPYSSLKLGQPQDCCTEGQRAARLGDRRGSESRRDGVTGSRPWCSDSLFRKRPRLSEGRSRGAEAGSGGESEEGQQPRQDMSRQKWHGPSLGLGDGSPPCVFLCHVSLHNEHSVPSVSSSKERSERPGGLGSLSQTSPPPNSRTSRKLKSVFCYRNFKNLAKGEGDPGALLVTLRLCVKSALTVNQRMSFCGPEA